MPQSYVDDPQKPKEMPRPCVMCGFPMFLTLVEPSDRPDHDKALLSMREVRAFRGRDDQVQIERETS